MQTETTLTKSERYAKLAQERFWARVSKTESCWNWTGSTSGTHPNVYGSLMVAKHAVRAHRFAYELLVGPIPDGLQIDHLCRNKLCVNPKHLEPVTSQINTLRGVGITARLAKATYCPKGHPYDLVNTYFRPDGSRNCRACHRLRSQIRNRTPARLQAARERMRRRRAGKRHPDPESAFLEASLAVMEKANVPT